MSLTTLLDRLTSFFSKSFTLGAFVPVVVFAFCNAALLYLHTSWFHSWADSQIKQPAAFTMGAIIVGLAVAAYLLSSVSTALRKVLEGRSLLPLLPPLHKAMRTLQQEKLDNVWKKYLEARNNNAKINQKQINSWQKRMSDAALQGIQKSRGRNRYSQSSSPASRTIEDLMLQRATAVTPEGIEEAVRLLESELEHNDLLLSPLRSARFEMLHLIDCVIDSTDRDKQSWQSKLRNAAVEGARTHKGRSEYDPAKSPAFRTLASLLSSKAPLKKNKVRKAVSRLCRELQNNDENASALTAARDAVLRLIDYAHQAWEALEVQYFNERYSSFGAGYVAPTLLGNIAQGMEYHAFLRYGIDLTFWTRLQVVLQSKDKISQSIQDATTQVDFLIACCALCALTWLGWTIALPFFSVRPAIFLLIALGGPLASYFFYNLATIAYATLADLVNSAVDLYRFSLLQALRIPLPNGVRQERALWSALMNFYTFAQDVELSYSPNPQNPNP